MKTDMSICNLEKLPCILRIVVFLENMQEIWGMKPTFSLQAPLGKLMSPMCHVQVTKFCISSKHLFNTYKIHAAIYDIYQRSLNEGKGGKEGLRRTFVIGPFSHPTWSCH